MKAAGRGQPPREVRVIGGCLRGSKLPVAHRPGLRPTPDRVRETLFNWLGQDLNGWRCLDAFAGSGALGFEAASRGAGAVQLLERDPVLVQGLRLCAARLKTTAVQVQQADALRWMQACAPGSFELVMLDPPFDADIHLPAFSAAAPLLVIGGWLYLEADRSLGDHGLPPGLALWRQGRAGAVHYHLLQRNS